MNLLMREKKSNITIKDEDLTENIRELLNYDEDSAGGLMAKELISVYENWSVEKCLREIRRHKEYNQSSFYICNQQKK